MIRASPLALPRFATNRPSPARTIPNTPPIVESERDKRRWGSGQWSVAMTGVVERLRRKHPKHKPLLISFDWTDIRQMQTLVAAANVKGRATPLAWASCRKHVYDGHRSRNAFEESLLLVLRSMIPPHVKVILLADRGFGRAELGRFCQRHRFHYIIRIQGRCRSSSTIRPVGWIASPSGAAGSADPRPRAGVPAADRRGFGRQATLPPRRLVQQQPRRRGESVPDRPMDTRRNRSARPDRGRPTPTGP